MGPLRYAYVSEGDTPEQAAGEVSCVACGQTMAIVGRENAGAVVTLLLRCACGHEAKAICRPLD